MNELFIISSVATMLLNVVPITLAETGVAIVNIQIRGETVRAIGAAAAVGDGFSFVGASTQTTPVLQPSTLSQEDVSPCPCVEQSTHAFAINTDGDINIAGLTGSLDSTILTSD